MTVSSCFGWLWLAAADGVVERELASNLVQYSTLNNMDTAEAPKKEMVEVKRTEEVKMHDPCMGDRVICDSQAVISRGLARRLLPPPTVRTILPLWQNVTAYPGRREDETRDLGRQNHLP